MEVDRTKITEQEWLALRKKALGGTDAAAVCGISKYKSALQVYLDKCGQAPVVEESEYLRWGRILEPVVLQNASVDYEKRFRAPIDLTPWPVFITSEQYPWMAASPDGRYSTPDSEGGVDIKTVGPRGARLWGDDSVPEDYYAQAQHYMVVTGLRNWLIIALMGNRLEFRHVAYNESFCANLIEAERHFWHDHLLQRQPPLPSGSEEDGKTLLDMYQKAEGEVELGDLYDAAKEYCLLHTEIKELEDRKRALTQAIQAKMGNAKIGVAGRYRAVWLRFPRKQFDQKGFAEDHPDLWNAYTKSVPSGRFTVEEGEE